MAPHPIHMQEGTYFSPVATDNYTYAAHPQSGGHYPPARQVYQRPMTAPGLMGGPAAYDNSRSTSPINFHSARPCTISPVAHAERVYGCNDNPMLHSYADGFGDYHAAGSFMRQGSHVESPDWGHMPARGGYAAAGGVGSVSPQMLKAEIRNAFVRAQAFLDLVPFFQSCDHSYTGGIPLRSIQEGLLRMGVALSNATLQGIGQLFSIPGSGLVDYVGFSRFLELDGQELETTRTTVMARRNVLLNNGVNLNQIFAQNDIHRSGFIPRTVFASILRDCGIPISESTMHFLITHLSKPTDTTMVSYVRFLDLTGGGMPSNVWTGGAQSSSFSHAQSSWYDGRASKNHKSKLKYSASRSSSSSSSSSSSGSDSSDRSRRPSRSARRKSERRSKSSSRSRTRGVKRVFFQKGEEIQAIPLGERNYQVGVITRVRSDGTYDIEFDNGQYEKHVEGEGIIEVPRAQVVRAESLSEKKSTSKSSAASSDEESGPKFVPGDRIEARFQGGERFFDGVIKKCRTDGSYDIEYDDSEVELHVRSKFIRKPKPKSPKKPALSSKVEAKKPGKEDEGSVSEATFAKGQRVEYKLKGSSEYVSGKIFRAHLDGTCDVESDSGDLEKHVPNSNIRLRTSKSPVKAKHLVQSEDEPIRPKRPVSGVKKPIMDSSTDDSSAAPAKKYKQGEKVEAKGKDKHFPATIVRCRLNGSYDIEYDNGEKENAVAASLIHPRASSSPSKKSPTSEETSGDDRKKKFSAYQKVEAKYKGKEKLCPAVIARCRLNGTYDIDYDDDDEPKAKKSGFKEGDKVEAQYKGKFKYYPGVISRCRLSGTFDIDYDDGEKETGVAAVLIRLKGDDEPKAKKSGFNEGEKVEAQYKGKSKFYPGVISRCRLNGTYDIDYDDGEKETGVAAELIRLKGGSSPVRKKLDGTSEDDRKPVKKFREGEKVEGQYMGKSKFYPGVISRCRLNGTYDIDYDDGEKETGVAAELIRSLSKTSMKVDDREFSRSTSVGNDSGQSYRVGARIEALYMGKDKYFKGTISRAHSDGTYDIEYDDSDKENKVPSKSIRPFKSTSNFSAAQFSVEKPTRPSPAGGARRRSGNSSD